MKTILVAIIGCLIVSIIGITYLNGEEGLVQVEGVIVIPNSIIACIVFIIVFFVLDEIILRRVVKKNGTSNR
jgi:hypothetical protein